MYVYFDINGDIKAITPSLDESFASICSVATFPLSEVEPFLTSKQNTFDYRVTVLASLAGTTYKLVKKQQTRAIHTRTLHNYLCKVEPVKLKGTNVIITRNNSSKNITIELSNEYKALCSSAEVDMLDLAGSGMSTLYITQQDNPYSLLESIQFMPRDLFSVESLQFDVRTTYTSISVYTKHVIDGYGFRERV
jgi:hypothetical protein